MGRHYNGPGTFTWGGVERALEFIGGKELEGTHK